MEQTRTEAPDAHAESEYDAIEAAVMETERGRWFLAEFARRNRTADTAKVLAAVHRLELAVGGDTLPANFDAIIAQVDALRAVVARAAIDAGISAEGTPGETASPGGDATRLASEAAAQRIRKAADHLAEIAERLKDQRPDLVARLEQSIVQIHSAASLFDLAAQRLTRVTGSLKAIESQVEELASLTGRGGTVPAGAMADDMPFDPPIGLKAMPPAGQRAIRPGDDEVLFFVRPESAA